MCLFAYFMAKKGVGGERVVGHRVRHIDVFTLSAPFHTHLLLVAAALSLLIVSTAIGRWQPLELSMRKPLDDLIT